MKTILYVVHRGGGGTVLTAKDLARSVRGYRVFLWAADQVEVRVQEFLDGAPIGGEQVTLLSDEGGHEYPKNPHIIALFEAFLESENIDLVHFRHLARQPLKLAQVVEKLGIPFVVSFHDFYYLCPSVHLVDADGQFCGGSCTMGKKDCTSRMGVQPSVRLRGDWVYRWREITSHVLSKAAGFVTTSPSVWAIYAKNMPILDGKKHWIIEHGRSIPRTPPGDLPPSHPPRDVVILGNIGRDKGLDLINALVRHYDSKLEFHLFGKIGGRFDGIHHGEFERDEIFPTVSEIKPAVGLIPPSMFETYSHVLTEFWALGIPVIATRLGALHERIASHGGGLLAEIQSVDSFIIQLDRITSDLELFWRLSREASEAPIRTLESMARDYQRVYEELL